MPAISETDLQERDVRLPQTSVPILQAHLAGVALTTPAPEQLSEFYGTAMGYDGRWVEGTWRGALDGRWLSLRSGAGNTLDHAAFAVPDTGALADLRQRLGEAAVTYEDDASGIFPNEAIAFADPDGNKLLFGVAGQQAESPTRTPPCRLQHIVFASDEAKTMVRFYCDVLGFAPSDYVRDSAGDLTSAFLRCSSEHHSLAIFRAPRKRLDHLCYDVADWLHIRDWADAFAQRHITLRWGPGRHGPGDNLFFFINDPDGNWLEFSAELEEVAGPRATGLWAHEERTLNSWGAAIMRS